MQYEITKKIVNKYTRTIGSLGSTGEIPNVGKDVKNKNELIFENLADYFAVNLPSSPTKAQFNANFPEKENSVWLWKYANAGQKAYLEVDPIPNASILFMYLVHCFDLRNALIDMLHEESKMIKYTPKQLYNVIKTKSVYDFEKLESKKFHVNPQLIFLYYYYILNYNRAEIQTLLKITGKIDSNYTRAQDLERDIKSRLGTLVNQAIRELIDEKLLDLELYYRTFEIIPGRPRYEMSKKIIRQLLLLKIKTSDFDKIDEELQEYLENDALKEYMAEKEVIFDSKTEKILGLCRLFLAYFENKMKYNEIFEKICKKQLKNASARWFGIILSKIALEYPNTIKYSLWEEITDISGNFYNFRSILQNILIFWIKNEDKIPSFQEKILKADEKYLRNTYNEIIESVLKKYLDLRLENKGKPYVLDKFIRPYLQEYISSNHLKGYLYEHSDEIGYTEDQWAEMLVNPKSGIQDPQYFAIYSKLYIANYFNQIIQSESTEEKQKVLEIIKEEGDLDEILTSTENIEAESEIEPEVEEISEEVEIEDDSEELD
jgi:hypothetical protein